MRPRYLTQRCLMLLALLGACSSEPMSEPDVELSADDWTTGGDTAVDVPDASEPDDATTGGTDSEPGADVPSVDDTETNAQTGTGGDLPDADEAQDSNLEPTDSELDLPGTADVPPPELPETVSAGVCGQAIPVACGDEVSSDTALLSTGQHVDETNCNAFFYPNVELVYRLVSPGSGKVKASIETQSTLDLLVLDTLEDGTGCDLGGCVGWSSAGDAATFDVAADQVSWLVVDGYKGVKGEFTLKIDCSDVTIEAPSCKANSKLACGDNLLVTADKPGLTANLLTYACGESEWPGTERVFEFLAEADVTATATVGEGDGTLFVLPDTCDPTGCTVAGQGSVVFSAKAGQSVFIVADTASGFDGSLSISLSCE